MSLFVLAPHLPPDSPSLTSLAYVLTSVTKVIGMGLPFRYRQDIKRGP